MSDVNSMVDRWFDIIDYDEDSNRIVLHFDDRRNEAGGANRLLSKMRKDYNSDMLTFCVLRHTVEIHKDVRITVREAMTPQFANFMEFVNEVGQSPLNENVTRFRQALEKFAARPDLIGEISDAEICERISEVGPLRNLADECLKSSGKPMKAEMRISKEIVTAPSLGELLLKTAGMPDGMVLGYVVREKAGEGFFSLMYKSNGNIISVNDRPAERYFGQFGVLSGRNDRYTEDKAFCMFPYTSVLKMTFKEDGVHDIIDKAEVRKEHMTFDDLTIDEALRFFVGCLLISSRLAGKVYEDRSVRYTTELTRDNLPLLESKALVNTGNRSITEAYRSLKLEIPEDSITSPPGPNKGMYAIGGSNTSPTLFREFFTPDMVELHSDYSEMLPQIRREYPNEMISPKENLELAVLHDIRRKLRGRIQEKIDAYYHEHGDGVEGRDAYRKIVLGRKDILLKNLCAKYHLDDPEKWDRQTYMAYMYDSRDKWHENRDFLPFNDMSNVVEKNLSGKYSGRYGKAYLKDEGGMCNMHFEWEPRHVDEICEMLEISEDMLPKEMRGYNRNRNYANGNSLLDVTDACQTLQNGYTSAKEHLLWPFNVVIAMSKKKWNKVFGKGRKDADD